GDRDCKAGIEEREGQSAHQAELRVRETELVLDRNREDADDLAVDEIEDVGEEQDEQDARADAGSLSVPVRHAYPPSSLREAKRRSNPVGTGLLRCARNDEGG